MFNPLAHLDDPVSRIAAGASATGGGLVAVAASNPLETMAATLAALVVPLLISAANRYIDRRLQVSALVASLAAAEATAAQLRAELARREAAGDVQPRP